MSRKQPPSFNPRERRQRPSVDDVKRVTGSQKSGAYRSSGQRPSRQRPLQADAARQSAAGPRQPMERGSQGGNPSVERRPVFHPATPTQRGSQRNARPQGQSSPQPHQDEGNPAAAAQPRQTPPSYAPQRKRNAAPASNYPTPDRRGAGTADQARRAGGSSPFPPRNTARSYPAQPQSGQAYPNRAAATPPARPVPRGSSLPPRRRNRIGARKLAVPLLILALLWPLLLLGWASSKLDHVNALSSAPDTAGSTYLIAGSDKRSANSPIQDETEGERADTIMVLHRAPNGQAALISIPRDTWVNVPGVGEGKINSAYAFGGPALLVETVEALTGLKADHYVEIGMDGVTSVVDAVGGVELCLDYDVSDPKSELEWKAGCHVADGPTALAFSRMRYSDPEGDLGRARRQREVVNSTLKTALSPSTLLQPWRQAALANAGGGAVTTDHRTGAIDLGIMAWTLRSATKADLTGTPPIARVDLDTWAGVAVELDEETAPEFFEKLRNGTLTPSDLKPLQ